MLWYSKLKLGMEFSSNNLKLSVCSSIVLMLGIRIKNCIIAWIYLHLSHADILMEMDYILIIWSWTSWMSVIVWLQLYFLAWTLSLHSHSCCDYLTEQTFHWHEITLQLLCIMLLLRQQYWPSGRPFMYLPRYWCCYWDTKLKAQENSHGSSPPLSYTRTDVN